MSVEQFFAAHGLTMAEYGTLVRLSEVEDRARDGVTGARTEGNIGFSVVRGGGIIGEHSVIFAGESESLTKIGRAHV